MKCQQVKTERGVSKEGGRGRKRGTEWQSERWSIGQKWRWCGLDMAVSEKAHLSILVTQINRINMLWDKSCGVGLKFLNFTGTSTFVLMTFHQTFMQS
jgi:hypothetical protein